MKTYALIIALLLSFTVNATEPSVTLTSELSFKITYHSLHLGYVKAVKQAWEATDSYTILGKAEGDLFFGKIVSENCIRSTFENGEFIKSVTLIKRNGKTLSNTNTALFQGKYVISTVETTTQLKREDIHFTVALLYFREPLGIDSIYSEAWGKLLPLTKSNSHYSFTIPDGTVCSFKYTNGSLEEVTSSTSIGEIKFTREQ